MLQNQINIIVTSLRTQLPDKKLLQQKVHELFSNASE